MTDDVLKGLDFLLVYLSDVVLSSKNIYGDIDHLGVVKEHIAAHGLKLKIPICSFFRGSVNMLGRVVDGTAVNVIQDKIKAMKHFRRIQTATELRMLFDSSKRFAMFLVVLHASKSV